MRRCNWIVHPSLKGDDAKCPEYCRYKMVIGESGKPERKYASFCAEHQKKSDAEDEWEYLCQK